MIIGNVYEMCIRDRLLIAMQKPEATYVAGYTSWQRNFDRQVMKGEKGIKILAPAPYKAQEEREKIDPLTQKPVIGVDGKAVTETVEVLRPAFKVVSVFDVSQTDGKELPDIIRCQSPGQCGLHPAQGRNPRPDGGKRRRKIHPHQMPYRNQ